MPPVRPTRPALRKRYDERRQAVVDAAARAFAVHGYAETTVQQLSVEIGIASGGIYHYFDSKRDLLIAICDQVMHPLLPEAELLMASEQEPVERFRALVRLWVAQVVERRDHILVFQQQRHVIDGAAEWRSVRESRKRFERLVGDALAAVDGDGARLRGEHRLALAALLGMVNHTAQWYRARGPLRPEQIADGYVELLLSGAQQQAAAPAAPAAR